MPNTGEVQRKGFKHEIFVKKLKDFEQRTTQNAKHCCQNATATTALLKAELMFSRYSPVKDFQALHEERLCFPKLQRGGQKRKIVTRSPLFQLQQQHQFQSLRQQGEGGAPHTIRRNKVAPFSTLGKPTCGFNFSRDTDNRKKNFGIMPSNLVKWRSNKLEKETIN